MAKTVKYNGVSYSFPDSTTGAQALAAMKVMFPELENGNFTEAGNEVTVFVVAQNKSMAKTVKYNGVSYSFPDSTTGAQALAAMKVMFPELENGNFTEAGNEVTVFVVAQNKSMAKTVKYNGVSYSFPDSTTGAQALAAMKVMFPELENGNFTEAGNEVTVFVVAQNKSVA